MDRRIEADPNGIINEFIATQDAESTLNNVLIQLQEYYAGPSVSHHGSEWIILPFKAPFSPGTTQRTSGSERTFNSGDLTV